MADRPIRRNNYGKWTKEELRRAEGVAEKFLKENVSEITETFRIKLRCLEILVNKLNTKNLTLDERLDCFAQIAEIANMIEHESEGFFELASQPIVARILAK